MLLHGVGDAAEGFRHLIELELDHSVRPFQCWASVIL